MADDLNTTAPMADLLNTTPLAENSDEGSVVPSNNNNATSDPNSSPPPLAVENSGGNFDIDEAAQPPEPNINIRALIGSMVAQATSAASASASFNMDPFGDTVREVVMNYVVQPSVSSLGSEIIDHFFVQGQNFNRRVAIMLFFFMLLLLLQRFLSAP